MTPDAAKHVTQALHDGSGKIGIASASIGGTGLTIQMFTDWMGAGLMVVNLILALGGLYMLYHKIMEIHEQKKQRKETQKEA